jgi:hypothetical protein
VFWIVKVTKLWDKVAWWAKLNNLFLRWHDWHYGWKKGLENFFPKLEAKASWWIPNTTIM